MPKPDAIRYEEKAQRKIRLEKICDGIYWGISVARADKRTGYVGKPVKYSRYTETYFNKMMRKWH